jgi:hypothetical protein
VKSYTVTDCLATENKEGRELRGFQVPSPGWERARVRGITMRTNDDR